LSFGDLGDSTHALVFLVHGSEFLTLSEFRTLLVLSAAEASGDEGPEDGA
jgi:hypothetical protein